ncbi:MAG: hypothetical protein HQK59_10620 [Deltaproteobacteria bacterium]|nr:hypothetical protein [Deltaproteobacteria bacterium]
MSVSGISAANSLSQTTMQTQMIQKMQAKFKATETTSTGEISKAAMPTAKKGRTSDTSTGASGMQVQSAMNSLMNATGVSGNTSTPAAMSALQGVLQKMADNGNGDGSSSPQTAQGNSNSGADSTKQRAPRIPNRGFKNC